MGIAGHTAVPLPRDEDSLTNFSRTELLELRDLIKSFSTVIKERTENDEEFAVEKIGTRNPDEARELSAEKKQPLLMEILREKRKKKCLSNNVYQGRCIPLN